MRPVVIGGQRAQAVSSVVCAKSWPRLPHKCYREYGLFQPSIISLQQSMGSGENGKRYQLHQPASTTLDRSCRTYPYNPNILIQHSCPLPDYNYGATLAQAGVVHIHFFL
jgi:hypothetical protein